MRSTDQVPATTSGASLSDFPEEIIRQIFQCFRPPRARHTEAVEADPDDGICTCNIDVCACNIDTDESVSARGLWGSHANLARVSRRFHRIGAAENFKGAIFVLQEVYGHCDEEEPTVTYKYYPVCYWNGARVHFCNRYLPPPLIPQIRKLELTSLSLMEILEFQFKTSPSGWTPTIDVSDPMAVREKIRASFGPLLNVKELFIIANTHDSLDFTCDELPGDIFRMQEGAVSPGRSGPFIVLPSLHRAFMRWLEIMAVMPALETVDVRRLPLRLELRTNSYAHHAVREAMQDLQLDSLRSKECCPLKIYHTVWDSRRGRDTKRGARTEIIKYKDLTAFVARHDQERLVYINRWLRDRKIAKLLKDELHAC